MYYVNYLCALVAAATAVSCSPVSGVTRSPSAFSSVNGRLRRAVSDTKPFTLQNGLDAQQGNAEAASISAGSACTEGETVCAGADFGQCVGGKIVTTACSSGLQCFVLPLVNEAGTSVACTTEEDAASRIAATSAQGGITGTTA